MVKERDAYTRLFEHIDKDNFFHIGIKDIVYIDNQAIKTQWEHLKKAVFNNQIVFIYIFRSMPTQFRAILN